MPTETLPTFRYHPDPIRTGNVTESEALCVCCSTKRGYVYVGPAYTTKEELDSALCPWCIANGSAADRYDAEFTDTHDLEAAGIDKAIIQEVVRRTPGFISWQGGRWLSHCGDACEFHGDLPQEKLEHVPQDSRTMILADLPNDFTWERIIEDYEPGSQPAIYWFKCRHCAAELYYADCT